MNKRGLTTQLVNAVKVGLTLVHLLAHPEPFSPCQSDANQRISQKCSCSAEKWTSVSPWVKECAQGLASAEEALAGAHTRSPY
jgi:hypothetical protein